MFLKIGKRYPLYGIFTWNEIEEKNRYALYYGKLLYGQQLFELES